MRTVQKSRALLSPVPQHFAYRALIVPIAAALLLSACARAAVNPEPTMQPVQQPPIAVVPLAPEVGDSARSDWHRLDYAQDRVLGVGSERALRELLANRQPQRRVIVAVIDGGIDTAHTMLAPVLWKNPKEVAGNGRDDDNNGLVDDSFGWNFTATATGEAVHYDTFEVTRLYAACRGQAAGSGISKPTDAQCETVTRAYGSKRQEITGTLGQIRSISSTHQMVSAALQQALGSGPLTSSRVRAYTPTSAQLDQAKNIWLQLDQQGLSTEELAKALKAYDGQARYGLDTLFNPRSGVSSLGSRDVTGPDASHGTHVAGIIGAARGTGRSVQGIAPNVSIMAVRAVPDGDERDVDVARAIRYAADEGASIINMSFGKGFSPNKPVVDSAVRYAESKGVLLVHAAGNDGANNDVTPSFPTNVFDDGSRSSLWIEVGASSWKGLPTLPTSFSNYGKDRVDLFAPGEDILSTLPGSTVGRESGTSMAAPVVSGVAALLMAYFPELTGAQVKDILLQSVRTFPDLNVTPPGGGAPVKFSSLSRTGGVIDAYAAVTLALQRTSSRP